MADRKCTGTRHLGDGTGKIMAILSKQEEAIESSVIITVQKSDVLSQIRQQGQGQYRTSSEDTAHVSERGAGDRKPVACPEASVQSLRHAWRAMTACQ